MKIWQLFYALWQGGQENRRRKKFSPLKCVLKSNVIKEKNWVLVLSFMYLVSVDPMNRSFIIKNYLEYLFPNVQCNQAWRSPAAFSKILSITMRVFIIDKDLNICWLFASIIACYFIQPCSETWQDCLDHFLFGFQMNSK